MMGMGMGKPSKMGGKPSGMPMDDEVLMDEGDMGAGDSKSGKLLALQNILEGISELSGEEMAPDIERLLSQVHMGHEEAEGDNLGMEQAQDGMMPKKPGIDVEIGLGSAEKPDEMGDEEEEDENGKPKGGFLAILSKKMGEKNK